MTVIILLVNTVQDNHTFVHYMQTCTPCITHTQPVKNPMALE